MRPKTKLFTALTLLLALSACNNLDKMLGNDDDDENPAPPPVVTPAPPAGPRFDIFNDAAGGGAVNTDPQAGIVYTGGMHAVANPGGTAGEGATYLRVHVSSDNPHIPGSVSFTLDRNGTGRTVDISGRTAIVFMIRFLRLIDPADQLTFSVTDGNGTTASFPLQSLVGRDPSVWGAPWQTVQIPLSSLAGLDLTKIRHALTLSSSGLANPTNHLDIDFDDVRYQ